MASPTRDNRWRTDGKFFCSGSARVRMRAVTYGPFPGGWPECFEPDFRLIAEAGFNAIRLFEMPDLRLLDAAQNHGLIVFGGLNWSQNADFFRQPARYSAAQVALVGALRETAAHPALAGVYVANEIPADLVRWMGPSRVRRAIEELIDVGHAVAPHLLFAYANFPSTEYLEPENADFTAFNVYLETPEAWRAYLRRLHHIAGDRPLVISEFGLDSQRNGTARQAETLTWAADIALAEETAGFTNYAWSDRWWNNGAEVTDWDFGLIDRKGNAKPALAAMREANALTAPPNQTATHVFSVIVCTRNGRERIGRCLRAVQQMTGAAFETLVVDDGSNDGTAEYVAENFPSVKLLRLAPCGLSAARNAGAAAAQGDILAFTDDDCEPDREWLARLQRVYADARFSAAGGPNLPPAPRDWREAVVRAAPGAPSHVMFDDDEAEHLPGCNLTVTRAAFLSIGGFDPQFHTAGDDVDFCWRLRSAGHRLGFAPGAFVWHWRRPSPRAFLKQQFGYGHAERLLIAKHPHKFSKCGGAKWSGFVYGGGPVRVTRDSIIYHGPMGEAAYQSVLNRMLPLRGIDSAFASWKSKLALAAVVFLAPRLRAWARNHSLMRLCNHRFSLPTRPADDEILFPGRAREYLIRFLLDKGWQPGGPTDTWDLEKQGTRLLLATEHAANGEKNSLIRLWGNPHLLQLPPS